MNTLDKQYQNLLQDILENGISKEDRTGTGTLSVFGRQIRHKMSEGFPLITTKQMYWKGIVTELLWFLQGDTNIKYLVENNCNIWNGDAYQHYIQETNKWSNSEPHNLTMSDLDMIGTLTGPISNARIRQYTKEEFIEKIKTNVEFAQKWGDMGLIYGHQWRSWNFTDKFTNGEQIAYVNGKIDQISSLIKDLKTNPDSRRLLVTAWNPADLNYQVLPPCHYSFQVYTRELSLEERIEIYGIEKINKNDNGYYEHSYAELILNSANIPTRKISLMFNMRSNDVPLGLPFNLASYGLLLEILAREVNMVSDELIASIGDAHIYKNQIDGIKEQLTREPYALPKLQIMDYDSKFSIIENINHWYPDDFVIKDYISHSAIKIPLSN